MCVRPLLWTLVGRMGSGAPPAASTWRRAALAASPFSSHRAPPSPSSFILRWFLLSTFPISFSFAWKITQRARQDALSLSLSRKTCPFLFSTGGLSCKNNNKKISDWPPCQRLINVADDVASGDVDEIFLGEKKRF